MPPRQADALSVFLARHPLVLDVERRGSDDTVEVLEIISHRLHPFLARQCIGEADERGPHSPHDLNRIRAEVPDLIEREAEIVLPSRHREQQPQSAALIDGVAGVQFRRAETAQEVLELVDSLDRGRRVVDRRRQRLDGDIDKKPDRIFWVLLEGSFALKMDGAPKCVLRQRRSRVVNMQETRTLDQRIVPRASRASVTRESTSSFATVRGLPTYFTVWVTWPSRAVLALPLAG